MILTHATTDQLDTAVEDNLHELFRAMAEVLDGELDEAHGVFRHLTFPMNPMFKGVWHKPLENADMVVDETIAWFKERNAPFFFWWSNDLGDSLIAHGLQPFEIDAPGMAADLSIMNEDALNHVPAGFTIERAADQQDLDTFKHLFINIYEVPEWAAQAWVDATLHAGIDRAPWAIYLGRLNRDPVAISILYNGAGVASVYGVGTLKSARGKGVGGAITLKPLLEARDLGYRYAVLFATDLGVPVYERIGFHQTRSRVSRYLWRNI